MTPERTYDQQPDRDLGPTVLIVDDEEPIRVHLQNICQTLDETNSLHVITAATIPQAIDVLSSMPVHVVLLDKYFGSDGGTEQNGIEAIPEMLKIRPQLQVLVVTASKSTQDVVEAMRLGAFGYVVKPTDDDTERLLIAQIRKAVEMAKLIIDKARLEIASRNEERVPIVAKSKATRHLLSMIPLVAESDRPVLLRGPAGSGKTEMAKLIHEYRKRFLKQNDRPFFDVNMAALSPTVIERELFGNEPGAYTGATNKTHLGYFELAHNGTLFLDEIADISLDVQAKLLTILQEGTFRRVGGTKKLHTSFKLICATNKNLEELIKKNLFREDLYDRIATFPIHLPPLRERKEDIPDLIRAVLPKMCKLSHVYVSYEELPKDFIDFLTNHPLEGNIRTLENKLSFLLTLSDKDRKGRPILKNWKKIHQVVDKPAPQQPNRKSINLHELMTLPLDVVGPSFPGLGTVVASIEHRILLDAQNKFQKNKDIANALRLSEGAVSIRLKHLKGPTTLKVVSNGDSDRQPANTVGAG